MKNTLMIILLCLIANNSKAQEVEFYLTITDKSRILSYNSGIPVFDSTDINDIFDSYTVTHFAKAFPLSGYEHLQIIYLVKCDSIGLAEELHGYDDELFPNFSPLPEEVPHSYQPNDWLKPVNDTGHLHLINAKHAWGITQGNPDIVIGVLDTYFDTLHEDMKGQYANIRSNKPPTDPNDYPHGTYVAGLVAAKTHNDTGTTGIGFKCRLNVSTDWGPSEMLKMALDTSKVKTRIFNASWGNGNYSNLYFVHPNIYFDQQSAYNELYEHGIVVVASAGNGNQDRVNEKPYWYRFPASCDHNLSITSVGYANTSGNYNVAYVHEKHVGDSMHQCHNHNLRVDLSAPGYDIASHYYKPSDTNKYKGRSAGNSGTSFSAPIVAGTVGLMLSKMSWLTPYQVEYILKKSSTDIYSITANQKYAGPTRWTGRIGAGTLNAGAALDSLDTDSLFADFPDARTFRIKGVKINTKCAPGRRPGLAKPRIQVIMENGTPPYKYKWELIGTTSQNGVLITPMIDSVGLGDSIILTIDTSWGSQMFNHRLTVYDNSEITKVANMVLKFQLLTDTNKWDLAMQDAYADLYEEPDTMLQRSPLNWNIWSSPDLWNRVLQDGDTTNQNATPAPPNTFGHVNYMYTRIKNVGCKISPDSSGLTLNVYWTLATTGEQWPDDWIGNTTVNGTMTPAGGFITPSGGTVIPPIAPGGETILWHAWQPPIPQNFDTMGLLDRIDVCALARIQQSNTTPFGMTFTETDTTKMNVLRNNNIVTRNFVSINLQPRTTTPNNQATGVVVGSPGGSGGTFAVQLITENQLHPFVAGHLASYMEVVIHMGGLYDVWDAGGKLGNATAFDDDLKTITWDMKQPLRLENISLDPNDKFYVILDFICRAGVSLPYEIENQLVHFRLVSPQTIDIDNGDGTTFQVIKDEVHSVVNYAVNLSEEEAEEKPGKNTKVGTIEQQKESWFDIYPNPVSGKLTVSVSGISQSGYRLTVTDVSGKIIFEDSKAIFSNRLHYINTSRYVPGTYYIQLTDKTGKSETRKFVKVE